MIGSMSTTKLGIDTTKSGVDSNLKSSVESGKDEKPAFGFLAASFGTPSFGTPSVSSSSFSRSSLSGSTQAATTPSSASFTLSVPANKAPGSREGDAATKQNDTKQAVPLTSAPTQNIWTDQKSTLSKATSTPEISFSTAVSQTVPTPSSVAPPPAAEPAPFGAPVITSVAAPTNILESGADGVAGRVNRWKLRNALAEGLDVQWGKKFLRYEEFETHVVAHFDDGTLATGDLLIGADGVKSRVRAQRCPALQLQQLPILSTAGSIAITPAVIAKIPRVVDLAAKVFLARALAVEGNTIMWMDYEAPDGETRLLWSYSFPAPADSLPSDPVELKQVSNC